MRTLLAAAAGLLLITLISIPAGGQTSQAQNPHQWRPGSINYVEGQASIGTTPLSADSAGLVDLEQGQTLTTQAGKVELLLTPGIFLRVADNSSLKMVSPNLANTEVQLDKGRAMIEVLNIHSENYIRIDIGDAGVRLTQKGLYDLDADRSAVRVFKGTAHVSRGDQKIRVTGGHEVALNATGKLKATEFDTRPYEDEFFRWSALRSGYLSEASVDEAREYIGVGPGWYGPGWYGAGWYWDPWFGVWTFVPADGIFYSPFGWGFYSPIVVYESPFFYWGHHPHHFNEFHPPYGHGFEPRGGFHGGFPGGHGGGAPGGGGHGHH